MRYWESFGTLIAVQELGYTEIGVISALAVVGLSVVIWQALKYARRHRILSVAALVIGAIAFVAMPRVMEGVGPRINLAFVDREEVEQVAGDLCDHGSAGVCLPSDSVASAFVFPELGWSRALQPRYADGELPQAVYTLSIEDSPSGSELAKNSTWSASPVGLDISGLSQGMTVSQIKTRIATLLPDAKVKEYTTKTLDPGSKNEDLKETFVELLVFSAGEIGNRNDRHQYQVWFTSPFTDNASYAVLKIDSFDKTQTMDLIDFENKLKSKYGDVLVAQNPTQFYGWRYFEEEFLTDDERGCLQRYPNTNRFRAFEGCGTTLFVSVGKRSKDPVQGTAGLFSVFRLSFFLVDQDLGMEDFLIRRRKGKQATALLQERKARAAEEGQISPTF